MHCRARIRTDSAKIVNYKEEIMAQLWGGRFTKETDQFVYSSMHLSHLIRDFMSRISKEVWHMSHAAKQGILTDAEKETIITGLGSI